MADLTGQLNFEKGTSFLFPPPAGFVLEYLPWGLISTGQKAFRERGHSYPLAPRPNLPSDAALPLTITRGASFFFSLSLRFISYTPLVNGTATT